MPLCRALSWRLLAFALLLHVSFSRAQLFYTWEDHVESIPLTQLWEEGAYKKIISIAGNITWLRHGDLEGKIVLSPLLSPHEPFIREFQRKRAAAVIFYREGTFPPGFSMYLVDGSNRSELALPAMEATFAKTKHFLKLPEGTFIQCLPTENLHKKANESKFQLVMNIIQSCWELAIICIAIYRVHQFYSERDSPYFSIAPLCCMFEGMAAALRLAYTLVDPFFTYRIWPYSVSVVFITISWPFSETAGILLTFFWAEALSRSNVEALPFISRYKWPAISVIVTLFVVEIVTATMRVVFPQSVIPTYVSCITAFVADFGLVVCYLSAAFAITRRIRKSAKHDVQVMTLRITISAGGYIICLVSFIAFGVAYQNVWGKSMTLNSIFIGFNLAGLMQVLALRPSPQPKPTNTSDTNNSSHTTTSSVTENAIGTRNGDIYSVANA